ncbi:MAG: TetR family transcriptional regulator [Ilumatobacter sp.]|nr:TetR family transcriptional regulator [bacterium]MDG1265336.1 TetR family transcriptional regulator [Ilumatobacter sp.]MDG2040275.1 TetR family transcriptional regulator [Ilumatobacter sp.]
MSKRLSATSPRTRRRPGRPVGGGVVVDRAQLLAAAAHVIRSEGPDATMAEIAAAATVTKPILYRAVGDRRALTFALSEVLVDRINIAVEERRVNATDPRAQFEGAVRGYLSAVDADRNLFLFVNGGSQDTDVIRGLIDRSAAQLIELFATARSAAGRDPIAARTWAYAIVGAFQVVTLMWLRDAYCDLDTVADDLTLLLWPGVATAGS